MDQPLPGRSRAPVQTLACAVAMAMGMLLAVPASKAEEGSAPLSAASVAAPSEPSSAAATPAAEQSQAPAVEARNAAADSHVPLEGASPIPHEDTAGAPSPAASPIEPAPLAPAPGPSFLDDPAGALTQMLAVPERRADLPHDLSPVGMFLAADWVVKAVMLGLAFASLATWTVWLAKSVEIACARGRARRALAVVAAAERLADAGRALAGRGGPAAHMVRAAEEEVRRSAPTLDFAGGDGLKERVASRLARIEAAAGRRLARGTGLLATIGATAPFVGLFGTVWGIMNAFIGISKAQTTNLAVVAPGIAEALLATAIGLVAAIPAVVIYNMFARAIAGYRAALADAASAVERLVSLDLDFRKVQAGELQGGEVPAARRAAE